MIRLVILALALALTAPAFAQSFSCRIGTRPACLDYGDTVCSSTGKCVNANAACFDTCQCDYEGFTCRSNVTACVEKYDDLLREHNDLLAQAKRAQSDAENAETRVRWATSLDEAQACY
jgi:hypothetical protein